MLAFIAVSYVAVQQAIFRKMELKNAGRKVLAGWLDEESKLGEEYEIPLDKITIMRDEPDDFRELYYKNMNTLMEKLDPKNVRENILLDIKNSIYSKKNLNEENKYLDFNDNNKIIKDDKYLDFNDNNKIIEDDKYNEKD